MERVHTMTRANWHSQSCHMCDEPIDVGQQYYTVPKERDMCIDMRERSAKIHVSCAAVNREVDSAARDLARKGLSGSIGDPLPDLMSADAVRWIQQNSLMFRHMVSHHATLARLYS